MLLEASKVTPPPSNPVRGNVHLFLAIVVVAPLVRGKKHLSTFTAIKVSVKLALQSCILNALVAFVKYLIRRRIPLSYMSILLRISIVIRKNVIKSKQCLFRPSHEFTINRNLLFP